tara:strand:- start:2305 stop:2505 length:201 start_codon:yes stop_codon:yes gene_type:complete
VDAKKSKRDYLDAGIKSIGSFWVGMYGVIGEKMTHRFSSLPCRRCGQGTIGNPDLISSYICPTCDY